MIRPEFLYNLLMKNEINFFSGVPDSLLKDFCAYLMDNTPDDKNIITANEGNALALASGYHLATGKIGLVYMQNSGLGNIVNPLLSLVDPLVYSIPALLLIGWRGEPGIKDEPQHIKQGAVTLKMLETMGVKYSLLPKEEEPLEIVLKDAVSYMQEWKSPYALVVSKGSFEGYNLKNIRKTNYELSREETLKLIISKMDEMDVIVSTTGMTSREIFEYREELGQNHGRDFLTVGSMGHALHIAQGIALAKPDRNVYCIDGDGAMLMHMGGMAVVGKLGVKNLRHVVINNGAHDSVGGQPTVGLDIDMQEIALACGYKKALRAEKRFEILNSFDEIKDFKGLSFLEIRVNNGARKDLGRPTTTPVQNKEALMEFLNRKKA